MARHTRFAQVFSMIGCCASLFSAAVLKFPGKTSPPVHHSSRQDRYIQASAHTNPQLTPNSPTDSINFQQYTIMWQSLPDYWQTFLIFYLTAFMINILFAFYMILDTRASFISSQIVIANFVFVMNIGCFLIFHYINSVEGGYLLNCGYLVLLVAVTASMGTCASLVIAKLQRDRVARHKDYHRKVDSIVHAQGMPAQGVPAQGYGKISVIGQSYDGNCRNFDPRTYNSKIYHTGGFSNEAFTMGASIEGVDLSHYI